MYKRKSQSHHIVNAMDSADLVMSGAVESAADIQWNLSVTTTSLITFITCDLFSNVF